MVCVRRQQSWLSPRVWVSFQHLPTLSHNTLEKANVFFVPLLTHEGTRTLKPQLGSGRPRVPLSPCLLYPPQCPLKIYSPPKPLDFGSAASVRGQKIYLQPASSRNYFCALLQPMHGPGIAIAPCIFMAFLRIHME